MDSNLEDGRLPVGTGLSPDGRAPAGLAGSATSIPDAGDRLTALHDAERSASEMLGATFAKYGSNRITVTGDEWDAQTGAFSRVDAARAALMPTEQDAINMMWQAVQRLKQLGWKEAIYCPKDGSEFDAIEPGSTGIHKTHYSGEWPTGGWMVADGGDLWPSHPYLYRPTEKELAEAEERKARFRAAIAMETRQGGDSEAAPSQSDDSAGRNGIAPASSALSDTEGR